MLHQSFILNFPQVIQNVPLCSSVLPHRAGLCSTVRIRFPVNSGLNYGTKYVSSLITNLVSKNEVGSKFFHQKAGKLPACSTTHFFLQLNIKTHHALFCPRLSTDHVCSSAALLICRNRITDFGFLIISRVFLLSPEHGDNHDKTHWASSEGCIYNYTLTKASLEQSDIDSKEKKKKYRRK